MEIYSLSKDNWISVEDDLPPEQQDVLVASEETNAMNEGLLIAFMENGKWYEYEKEPEEDIEGYYGGRITHWQPLPDQPKRKKKETDHRWISVNDELPEEGVDVEVMYEITDPCLINNIFMAYLEDKTWYLSKNNIFSYGGYKLPFIEGLITHWRFYPRQ